MLCLSFFLQFLTQIWEDCECVREGVCGRVNDPLTDVSLGFLVTPVATGGVRPIECRTNGVHFTRTTSVKFLPTLRAAKTVPVTTPPCHYLRTNQETLTHQGPFTSGYIMQYSIWDGGTLRVPFPSDDQRLATI
ncbi:hypothetical protein TNCV_2528161 [Trichonephila clavipes]|nr:hypothetical protein TNCV_2528161 [Trichonephila clavipes]